jgi:hypothetical protein
MPGESPPDHSRRVGTIIVPAWSLKEDHKIDDCVRKKSVNQVPNPVRRALYVQCPPFGQEPLELLAESDNRFFTTNQPFVIEFQREADGSIKKAKARNVPEDLEGEKISDTP